MGVAYVQAGMSLIVLLPAGDMAAHPDFSLEVSLTSVRWVDSQEAALLMV